MHRYILDASALMTRFLGRPGAAVLEKLLADAAKGKASLFMSCVNWGEVYYNIWNERGQRYAEYALRLVDGLPIRLMDANRETTKLAAELKAKFGLHYADSFAAALAQQLGARVVTGDPDFRKVEKLVEITWLG